MREWKRGEGLGNLSSRGKALLCRGPLSSSYATALEAGLLAVQTSSPSRVRGGAQKKSILVQFSLKIGHLIRAIFVHV